MIVLIFRPGQKPTLEELGPGPGMFDAIRAIIGGEDGPATIERVTLEPNLDLWLDEDGIGKGLEWNVFAVGALYPSGTPVVGTAVLAYSTVDDEGESTWHNLPEAAVRRYSMLPRLVRL